MVGNVHTSGITPMGDSSGPGPVGDKTRNPTLPEKLPSTSSSASPPASPLGLPEVGRVSPEKVQEFAADLQAMCLAAAGQAWAGRSN